MPKPSKQKQNISFDGVRSIRYSFCHVYNKIEFVVNGEDLKVKLYSGNKLRTTGKITNFKNKTASEIIQKRELGNHFEDGIFEIWKYYKLPLGFVKPLLKEWGGTS